MGNPFKDIPAVGDAVHWKELAPLLEKYPRTILVNSISKIAENLRSQILQGKSPDLSRERFVQDVAIICHQMAKPKLHKVINATGIIVHTNLGRSVLSDSALKAVVDVAGGYSTLEYDLDKRARGSRHALVSELLCTLTGAEAAIAVNNNAGAVLLALNSLAFGKQVVVSRGELVEIGGSFRIPDIMAKSGCELVEVGTTNKTHPHDYRNAVSDDTALFLKAHTSNFRILGFSSEVKTAQLVEIGREFGIPVMEDLGSGYLIGPDLLALRGEPIVQDVVASGADVVTFSGDKLLGGPQAGIILGSKSAIAQISKNPIARAVRCDKMTLAALEATLRIYQDPKKALKEVPTLKMVGVSIKVLREKARRLAVKIREKVQEKAEIHVVTTTARVGGGAFPLFDLPSAAVAIKPRNLSVNQVDKLLHQQDIPVIGRIEDDQYLFDVRTLLDGDAKILQNAVCNVLKHGDS